MLWKSRVKCDLAIQAVNTALLSLETTAKDNTLVAAMLLLTFEIVAYEYQRDIKAYTDQLTGGLALLMIRGTKQLDTRFGLQIFLQAYFLAVSVCIQTELSGIMAREPLGPDWLSCIYLVFLPYLTSAPVYI
jgi:hypothetical protein